MEDILLGLAVEVLGIALVTLFIQLSHLLRLSHRLRAALAPRLAPA